MKRRNLLKGTALVAGASVVPAKAEEYLLFVGDCYYPQGGPQDLVGRYPSIESARLEFIDICANESHPLRSDHWGSSIWAVISDPRLNVILTANCDDDRHRGEGITFKWMDKNWDQLDIV